MEIRLPVDTLTKCQTATEICLKKKKVQMRDLQSVAGTLNVACGAVLSGRPFLRRLINLTVGIARPHFNIRITEQVEEGLNVWLAFLSAYSAKSLLLPERRLLSTDINLFTDASGMLEFGTELGPQWFSGSWDERWMGRPITLLEFYPIFLAIKIWVQDLANNCICFYTDNEALVEVIKKQ